MSRAYITCPTDVTDQPDAAPAGAELLDLHFVNQAGDDVVWVRPRDRLEAHLTFRLHRPIRRLVAELNMRASVNENLLSFNSGRAGRTFDLSAGVHSLILTLPGLAVGGGQYFWNVRFWDADRGTTELDTPFRFPLVVDDEGRATGVLCLDHEWSSGDPSGDSAGGRRMATDKDLSPLAFAVEESA
jgi:hypothetical protein